MSDRNVTPFIPPLLSPQGSPQPPVIPDVPPAGYVQPSWVTTPMDQRSYPVYPSSPYTGTPFIPNVSPRSPPTHGFIPSGSSPFPGQPAVPPGMGGGGRGGFSADYTGFPTATPHPPQPQMLHPGTPWVGGAQGPPVGTPWNPAQQIPPQFPPPQFPPPQFPPPQFPPPQFPPPQQQYPLQYPSQYPPQYPQQMHGGAPPPAWHTPAVSDPWGLPQAVQGWAQHPPPAAPAGWPGAQVTPAPWHQQLMMQPPAVQPQHFGLGRTAESELNRVNQFAIGNHYGPVLEPLLIRVVGAQVQLNPLLTPLPEDGSDKPHLKWNMLFATNTCQRSTDPSHVSWSNGRQEPATFPRVTSLRLISKTFPWIIDVYARNANLGVTCGEVIDTLGDNLSRLSDRKDYEALPRERARVVGSTYRHNRSRAHGVPGGQLGEAMRRLDFLGQDTMFGGVDVDNAYVQAACGAAIPCTFVVKCLRRYPMSEQENREHERLVAATRAAGTPRPRSVTVRSVTTSDSDEDD